MPNNSLTNRYIAIDYLRSFLTTLVVLYHILLAYTTHGFGSLVVDKNNFFVFDTIIDILDTSFMFLFFFISGLFVIKSINKKGVTKFLKNRVYRLGIPFLVGWLLINIPAHYILLSSYLGKAASLEYFFIHWVKALNLFTNGPLWFLWVLFLFNIFIVIIYKIFPNTINKIKSSNSKFFSNAKYFLLTFFILGTISYIPISTIFDGWFITIFGPFSVQLNRIILYFLFFSIGTIIGVRGMEKSLFSQGSNFIKKWWILITSATLSYFLLTTSYLNSGVFNDLFISPILFVSSSILLSFSLLIISIKYIKKTNHFFDNMSKNAYGIYIVHYSVVVVFQFLFLNTNISGVYKALIVFPLSFFTSWFIVYLFRKITIVKKIIG